MFIKKEIDVKKGNLSSVGILFSSMSSGIALGMIP
jgi:hypothetical protein